MKIARRAPLGMLAALLVAISITACGGSSSSNTASGKNAAATTTTKSKSSAAYTAFTDCLKQQGVTLPKRGTGGFGGGYPGGGTRTAPSGGYPGGGTRTAPSGGYPGGTRTAPSGGYPGGGVPGGGFPGGGGGFAGGNSKFAKAIKACRSKLPKGGFAGRGFGRGRFGSGANAGTGAPQFSSTALKSYVACVRKSGYPAMPEPNTSGKGSVFPNTLNQNAKFKAANAKCEGILLRSRSASGQTTPTTSSTSST